jgi:hypothetical protein
MAIKVEAGVTKRLRLNSQCINQIRISGNHNYLYAAMDWLLPRQARIEDKLAARHLQPATVVLYDVTSTYFEGRRCPLAQYGHSRDERPGNLQIVFGLLTNPEGCPVAVEVFEGNTADPKSETDSSSPPRAGKGPCVLMHAGLLRGVAYAPGAGAAVIR